MKKYTKEEVKILNKARPYEKHTQRDVVNYLKELKLEGKITLYFAVINEASYMGAKNGLVKGVSDLVIIFKNHTLYLELKREREMTQTKGLSQINLQKDEQKDFEELIKKTNNNSYHCTYGFQESKDVIDSFIYKYPQI